MKLKETTVNDRFGRNGLGEWRQVKAEAGRDTVVRVVTWIYARPRHLHPDIQTDLVVYSGWWHHLNLPDGKDRTNHESFCRGHLPAHMYADWLEEIGVQLPRAAYDLLRGWV